MVSGEVHNDEKIKIMTISTKWTIINFLLSVIGSVSGSLVYDYSVGGLNEIISHRYSNVILYYSSFLPTFVPAAIFIGLLFFSEKICSPCSNIINLPIVYKTGVDSNDFSHIIDLQTGLEYGTNEDVETESNAHQLEPLCLKSKLATFWKRKQMQIGTLNEQVETLTTQISELREKLTEWNKRSCRILPEMK